MTKSKLALAIVLINAGLSFAASADMVTGTYIVPASKDGSIPEMFYTINSISVVNDPNSGQVVTFQLPEDLLGPNSKPVVMTQDKNATAASEPGTIVLQGAGVRTPCLVVGTTATCKMQYNPGYIQEQPGGVSSFLSQKFAANPALLASKLNFSASFLADPEGVLVFSLPTK